ncbi:hypothetical protein RRG08_036835 [Elysia crispata]|uniref:Uncharacterized protein n=1 Tax=Elysia crispata TaxID=231223 RepID=A0AAE0Y7U5_9GAST|nr:hypothetical protein RRG08_036835 [Elysia crispata]
MMKSVLNYTGPRCSQLHGSKVFSTTRVQGVLNYTGPRCSQLHGSKVFSTTRVQGVRVHMRVFSILDQQLLTCVCRTDGKLEGSTTADMCL